MRKLQNRHSICAVLVIFVCGAIIASFLHADTPLRPSNNPPTEAKRATDSTPNTRNVVAKRTDLSKRLTRRGNESRRSSPSAFSPATTPGNKSPLACPSRRFASYSESPSTTRRRLKGTVT